MEHVRDLDSSQCNQHVGKIWVCRDRQAAFASKGRAQERSLGAILQLIKGVHCCISVYFPLAPSDNGGHGGPTAGLKMGEMAETLVHGESYQDQAPSGK